MLTIISWNINGYSDNIHNYIQNLLMSTKPDLIFLSETKRKEDTLRAYFNQLTDYHAIINVHVPTNMHGVAMLIRKDRVFEVIPLSLNIPSRKDTKNGDPTSGRLISILFESKILILGAYVPNSGIYGLKNLNYRIQYWDPAMYEILNHYRQHGPTIWLGDLNVAPTPLDVSDPTRMRLYPGFTLEERTSFNRFLTQNNNWIDTWRHYHPTEPGYTWRGRTTGQDYGMRLDLIIISPDLVPYITDSFRWPEAPISDHIPIGIKINLSHNRK